MKHSDRKPSSVASASPAQDEARRQEVERYEADRADTRRPNSGCPDPGSPQARGPNRRPQDLGPPPASGPVMPTAPGAKAGKALRDAVDEAGARTPDVHPKSEPARTLNHRPDDPNRLGADSNFPPGVEPEVARDPGSMTPGAPKVDNRS